MQLQRQVLEWLQVLQVRLFDRRQESLRVQAEGNTKIMLLFGR